MKRTDRDEAGRQSWQGRGSWGVQVLLILAVGLLVATLGWFTGQQAGPAFERPRGAMEAGNS